MSFGGYVPIPEAYRQIKDHFVHLMKRVDHVTIGESFDTNCWYLVLHYGHADETVRFENTAIRTAEHPGIMILEYLQKLEDARRPKHSTELHTRLMRGRYETHPQ